MGPFLQQLTQPQQEHHGIGRGEIHAQNGDGDGKPVQQLHMELPAQQAAQTTEYIGNSGFYSPQDAQRLREKDHADELKAYQIHQFFLIKPADGAAAVHVGQGFDVFCIVPEAADGLQQIGTCPAVTDHGAAGSLMDDGLLYAIKALQPGLQQVGLR